MARVLVACEFSGIVRDAFASLGHDAWSCDLLPSESEGQHIEGDVLEWLNGRYSERAFPSGEYGVTNGGKNAQAIEFLNYRKVYDKPWDLMIAHPPCTYLCNSGVRWLVPGGKLNEQRHKLMREACDFFAVLYWAPCELVCVENPIMHKYARAYLADKWKVPMHSMTLQPFQHGHGETKRTALWLRGLPLLTPTKIVEGRTPRVHHASPVPDRWKERSRTLPGIATAMAEQWGSLL